MMRGCSMCQRRALHQLKDVGRTNSLIALLQLLGARLDLETDQEIDGTSTRHAESSDNVERTSESMPGIQNDRVVVNGKTAPTLWPQRRKLDQLAPGTTSLANASLQRTYAANGGGGGGGWGMLNVNRVSLAADATDNVPLCARAISYAI